MCLSIPGKIIKKDQVGYQIEYPEVKVEINNSLIKNLKIGDWVIVQQKFITQKLTSTQAKEIYKLMKL